MNDPIFRPLRVPDRYETLLNVDRKSLSAFIDPVVGSLSILSGLLEKAEISSRGQFMIVESKPGVGKTTFLNTADLFINDLAVSNIPSEAELNEFLGQHHTNGDRRRRLLILEGRESVDHVTENELSQLLHVINQRLRSPANARTIVAWPCNSSPLADRLSTIAGAIGGTALIDPESGRHKFRGPDKKEFRRIASNTIGTLNDSADLLDIGIDEYRFTEFLNKADCVGDLFNKIVVDVSKKRAALVKLRHVDRHRMWVVVAAGSEPEKEIGGLTRGAFGACDIQRLCNSTRANIVADVKDHPDKLGLLVGFFDARITLVPVVTLLSLVRAFADEALAEKLRSENIRTDIADKADAVRRVRDSQLASLLRGEQIGLLLTGKTVGTDTKKSFANLSKIATSNDIPLNRAFAEGLKAAGLIESFSVEDSFGDGFVRKTDILAKNVQLGTIRIEMMWRKTTSKAEIANYALTKLYQYGKALGFLKTDRIEA